MQENANLPKQQNVPLENLNETESLPRQPVIETKHSNGRLNWLFDNVIYNSFSKHSNKVLELFVRVVLDIIYETAVVAVFLLAIHGLHKFLDYLLGKDATFFGYVPIGYVIDALHLLAIIRFSLEIIKDIKSSLLEIFKRK